MHHLRAVHRRLRRGHGAIGKPRGLIDYLALSDETRERDRGAAASRSGSTSCARARCLYTALWSLVGIGLVVALFLRPDLDDDRRAVRNPLYVAMSDGIDPQHL
jgi:polyferredoxin